MKTRLKHIIVLIMAAWLLSSCTLERKLALDFIEGSGRGTPIMLVPPQILYMYNNKALVDYNQADADSLSFFSSKYLQYISDSTFMENYMNAFIEKAYASGLNIYLPHQLNQFLKEERHAYIVRIANMELSEDSITWEIEEQANFRKINKEINANQLILSTWFEISEKDSVSYFTYFDEHYIADELSGEFYQNNWTLDVSYDYSIYDLEENDIYQFATLMGQTHASYVFDLILNTYIWNHLHPEKRGNYHYLHYNAEYHSIEIADDAFIMLENE